MEAQKPGLRLGSRPERVVDTNQSPSETKLQNWFARAATKKPTLRRFAAVAESIAQERDRLEKQSVHALDNELRELRQQLQTDELSDALFIRIVAQLCVRCSVQFGFHPHHEQLYAVWSMVHGVFVEMQTGEGKTLTAGLCAIVAALTGVPVHVVTANDYLVERDARTMHPLVRQFGLRVTFVNADMSEDERRTAYAAHIVYCSNKQLIFDYLRDQTQTTRVGLNAELASLFGTQSQPPLLRGLCFAIVDEADYALIDDARTPMVLSRSIEPSREDVTDATIALSLARALAEDDYQLKPVERYVALKKSGIDRLRELTQALSGRWLQPRYVDARVRQALEILHLFHADQHYVVQDDAVLLVDESSGRTLPDRKLQNGMHQLLELKAGIEPTPDTEAVAALRFQQFFPRYLHLTGMSGTLLEARQELASVYERELVVVPPHKPCQRISLEPIITDSRKAQLKQIAIEIKQRTRRGQPVLVGTRTVAMSERISRLLTKLKLDHALLNARQDADEAEVVAQAGQPGAITVATNMAGRGTDIPLHATATEAGGLHVLCVELNDSGRVDRQLAGRAARQGDLGSTQSIICLEDELLTKFVAPRLLRWVRRWVSNNFPGSQWAARHLVRSAQQKCERHHKRMRDAVHTATGRAGRRLAFTGELE